MKIKAVMFLPKNAKLLTLQEAVQQVEQNFAKEADPFKQVTKHIILDMLNERKISAWQCKDGIIYSAYHGTSSGGLKTVVAGASFSFPDQANYPWRLCQVDYAQVVPAQLLEAC